MFRTAARKSVRSTASVIVAGLALLVATSASAATITPNTDGSTTVSDGAYSFKNFQLGAGLSERCPNQNSPCQNGAAEPAIRADKFGNFFGSSENGLTSGSEAWKSIDGGRHYLHLSPPNNVSAAVPGAPAISVSPAGGDTDLSIASAKNSLGVYNVYVASLDGVHTVVSTSLDSGNSWRMNFTASKFAGEDREWIAADGANKVCISYVSAAGVLVTPLGLHVECSYDAGQTFMQIGDAIEPLAAGARLGFKIGNLMIDQNSGNRANVDNPSSSNDIIYQTYASGTVQDATNPNPTDFHIVWMAVSLDGGKTFKDYQVYNNPDSTIGYAHNFTNVSVDQAGNVYSFFSDDHYVYFKYSTDRGKTWQPGGSDPTVPPIQISRAPASTAIFPWSTAGDAGKVDLVYYGADYYGTQHPDNYPPSANWHVYFAQNLNVLGTPSSWTQVQASPINHHGAVCEGGIACTGNRDLYDDFGVAARPGTGLASIIYSDDQYDQFNHAFPSSCTAANNNKGACDHTSIATQLTGSGIFSGGTGGGGGGTCHEGDGGGDMQSAKSGTAHASFDADGCKDGDTNQVEASDPGAGEDFKSTQVQSIAFDDVAHSVTMFGTGLSNGKAVNFQMVAVDNGALPGMVLLTLDDGYTLSGTLISGVVTLK